MKKQVVTAMIFVGLLGSSPIVAVGAEQDPSVALQQQSIAPPNNTDEAQASAQTNNIKTSLPKTSDVGGNGRDGKFCFNTPSDASGKCDHD